MFSAVKSISNSQEGRLASALLFLCLLFAIGRAPALAQQLPDSIRGYKVHKDKIAVSTGNSSNKGTDASVKIGDPTLIEAALAGITFELPAEVRSAKQSGKVDFLTFHEVRVNGIPVDVEEYRHPFEFRKGESLALPKPARIFLPITGLVQAGWSEMRVSKTEWTVSGRVFVFGRFRKFGMYHKRVVPVDFEIKIKNPISAN